MKYFRTYNYNFIVWELDSFYNKKKFFIILWEQFPQFWIYYIVNKKDKNQLMKSRVEFIC